MTTSEEDKEEREEGFEGRVFDFDSSRLVNLTRIGVAPAASRASRVTAST